MFAGEGKSCLLLHKISQYLVVFILCKGYFIYLNEYVILWKIRPVFSPCNSNICIVKKENEGDAVIFPETLSFYTSFFFKT